MIVQSAKKDDLHSGGSALAVAVKRWQFCGGCTNKNKCRDSAGILAFFLKKNNVGQIKDKY